MWYLWWTKCHMDTIFSAYIGFAPLSITPSTLHFPSFHDRRYVISSNDRVLNNALKRQQTTHYKKFIPYFKGMASD